MSSNLFARFIEVIKRPGFLISRLIIVGILTVFFLLSFVEDPFVVYEMYLPVEGEPDEDVSKYLEKFKNENSKEELAIHWHPSTGTPTAVFGKLDKFDVASEENARKFLLKNKELFKFRDNLEDLTVVDKCGTDSPVGKHFVFEQRYKTTSEDIKISIAYGGRVGVSFNNNAEIIAISNTYLPNIQLDSIISKIEQERNKAKDIAKAILNVKKRVNFNKMKEAIKSDLVIYLFNKEIKLSWRFVIYTYKNTWEVFIDAQNKLCLGSPRDIKQYYVKGKGEVFNVNPIAATCERGIHLETSTRDTEIYKEVLLEGLNGNGYLDGEYIVRKDTTVDRIKRPDNDFRKIPYDEEGFAELMIYCYIDFTARYIQKLGFRILRKEPIEYIIKNDDYSSSYDDSTKILSFSGKRGSRDAEIIIHEYAHAIQDYQIPGLSKDGETDAIKEGFADYLAASVAASLVEDCKEKDPMIGYTCIGEWRGGDLCGDSQECLRKIDIKKKYTDYDASRISHCNGLVWSAALWHIRKKIQDNGNDVSDADKIVLASHKIICNQKIGFNESASAIVLAAENLQKERRLSKKININEIRSILVEHEFILNKIN
ncbi:MAG: M36 family metallopeptidase [Acidobacteria bacterium]|nr:M36 family metallopeptidase [Acidobacteriota bacterium]